MRDLRERRDEAKIRSIRRRASKQTASNPRPRRLAATGKATAHQTVSVHELALSIARYVRFGSKADIEAPSPDVRVTPESGHYGSRRGCALSASSRHFEFSIHRLRLWERPRAIEDFSTRTIEPHHVVPAIQRPILRLHEHRLLEQIISRYRSFAG
jgi:hypothetical protein